MHSDAMDAAAERVVAVLGGASLPSSLLRSWATSATFIAAADSGADALLNADIIPDLVVGDLDSLRADRSRFPHVVEDPDQLTTDCDKLLSILAARGVKEASILNVHGGLPDHELAILHSCAKSNVRCRIVYEQGFGFVLSRAATISTDAMNRVSLIPLTPSTGVVLTGVRWPLDHVALDPLGLTSVSNVASEGQVQASIDVGAALLFVERSVEPMWPTWA